MARASRVVLYGVSFAIHASLGVGVTELEPSKQPERVAITVVDVPKAKPRPRPEEPPPLPPVAEAPTPARPEPRAKPRAEPRAKAAPVQPAPVAPPAFGIAMTGGVGMGGVAVPIGDALQGAPTSAATKRVAEARTLVEPKRATGCDEPAGKPKPLAMARPEYTDEAKAARIEGKVRVEIAIDASGQVKGVRVLDSLGHGLDEAALRAVQSATFEPARECGKPVAATFVVGIRFSL